MKLQFLGTRGGILARSSAHYMHSSLLIQHQDTSLIIDWGEDWLNKKAPSCSALLLTHGHSDHVGGLKKGFKEPVYATEDTFNLIKKYPLNKKIILHRQPFTIGSLLIEAFPVNHSIRAPAVGYRISSETKSIFYVSDLVSIIDEKDALKDLAAYIGDGALIKRRMLIRMKEGVPTGHAPIADQLAWCKNNNVPQAIITHCGSEIVKGNPRQINEKIQTFRTQYGLSIIIASDGLKLSL